MAQCYRMDGCFPIGKPQNDPNALRVHDDEMMPLENWTSHELGNLSCRQHLTSEKYEFAMAAVMHQDEKHILLSGA